ncbi:extensin-like domain-containing protein [Yoonia litorea]|uniref:Extensin-like protein C-terminus n=1 Tax=Yoonia litorea TaxID=1123755 RepID=A0A1I6MVA4_9RHOB|nr:extensin family protein [Yoonia litorea]SFS19584.1 Extensin-like protein C-terminus [Yoonia litorea]
MRHGRRQQIAERASEERQKRKGRSLAILSGLAAFSFAGLLAYGVYLLLTHPQTPLPSAWNPTTPLQVSDAVTPLTSWKLDRTAKNYAACLATMDAAGRVAAMSPLEESEQCFIRDRVNVSAVGSARVDPLETRCAIALRLAMWEEHSLQPAALTHLGSRVSAIRHFGSYSCRQIRTPRGTSSRMSTHATANAIDISGFDLENGRRIRLVKDWDGDSAAAADFLRQVRDGACDWFELTLSPDYNRLHADHFHLQSRGWGGCR